jgi:hypothetical protein
MGIVSFCPQGHRVKVKDALAGKKGICPTCGARFRIPLASVEPPAPAAAGGEAAALPLAAIVSLEAAMAERLPRAVPIDHVAAAVHDVRAEEANGAPPVAEVPAPIPSLHPLIAERPDLVWCHAEPGGAPSEPLGADAMQAWLSSGRPAAGALVWRADWADWRPLAAAFPEHAGR